MKNPVKYIVVGKFSRDGNGNPCISLSKDDLNFIDMDHEYQVTIEGPFHEINHKTLKNNNKSKSIIRISPGNSSLFLP